MSQNQHNHDHEASELHEEEEGQEYYAEEEYFIATLNSVSESIVSDGYYGKNEFLIRGMINDLCDRHNRQGDMPPSLAGKTIEVFFSSIAKFGLR